VVLPASSPIALAFKRKEIERAFQELSF